MFLVNNAYIITIQKGLLYAPKTILFLDEIQAQPRAITALRYFREDHPLISVIAAGSLLELVLAEEVISFPVGRIEMEYLGPMMFSEFIEACYPLLYSKYQTTDLNKISESLFDSFAEAYRKFIFIGGMPEAVRTYQDSKSLLDVRRVHHSILGTYKIDFPKYAKSSDLPKLDLVFDNVIQIIAQKLKYSAVAPDLKSKDVRRIIELLQLARLVIPCYHTNANEVPLSAGSDLSIRKLFFLDVGLYNTMMQNTFEDSAGSQSDPFKGTSAEQFVAQHLAYGYSEGNDLNLYYWLKDKGAGKAEVDFIHQQGRNIFPVEVKAEKLARLKSLMVFMSTHKSKLGIKISLEPYQLKSFEQKISDGHNAVIVKGKLMTFPIFFIEKLNEILKEL